MDVKNTNPTDPTVLTLEKFKPFDATLIETAADYANLVIVGTDDKKGYKAVSDAISRLTKLRTGIEQTRVEIKAPALAFGKRVDLEAKRLTDLISGAENKLRKERQRIDAIVEQNRQEAERVEMELLTRRADALFKTGFVFDGVDYVAGDLKILAEGLTSLTEDKFGECLRMGAEQVEAERAAKLAFKLAQDERERELAQAAADAEMSKPDGDGAVTVTVVDVSDQPFIEVDVPADNLRQIDDLLNREFSPRPERVPAADLERIGTLIDRARDPLNAGRLFDLTKFLPLATDPPDVVAEKMFVAGFESFREKILLILDRPDKFTRDQLRGIIQGLK